MVLRRAPKVSDAELFRGFKGNQRVLASIVRAALKRAGYQATFLSDAQVPPGLCIGTSGDNTISVSQIKKPQEFGPDDARRCAERLNHVFGQISSAARSIATVTQGTTSIGHVPYAEIIVRCPNAGTLRALHKELGG